MSVTEYVSCKVTAKRPPNEIDYFNVVPNLPCPLLHRQGCDRISAAVAALDVSRRRLKQSEGEMPRRMIPTKVIKSAKNDLKHDMCSDRYISWSVGATKGFKRAAMKPEVPLAGYPGLGEDQDMPLYCRSF